MVEIYRGHSIRLIRYETWRAEVVERDTGVLLPTMATASPDEGVAVCAKRARELIDLYLEAEAVVDGRHRSDAAHIYLKLIQP